MFSSPLGSNGVQNPPVFTTVPSQSEPQKNIFNDLNDSQQQSRFSIPGPSSTASSSLDPPPQVFTPQPSSPPPTTQRKASSSSVLSPPPSSSLIDNAKPTSTYLPNFSPLPASTTNGIIVSPSSFPAAPPFFDSYKPSPTASLPSSLPTPPVNGRLIAPPLLKINTNTSTSSSSISSIAGSPLIPPALPKLKPISLPPTPSTSIQQNPLLDHLRSTFDPPGTPRTPEVLSPLVIGTPTASGSKILHNFSPLPSARSTKQDISPIINGKGKTPQTSKYDENKIEEMKNKALMFAQRSLLVKNCFKRWLKVATDRAEWLEACQNSNAYREQVHSRSRPTSQLSLTNGKRRISAASGEANSPPAQRKRARRRISSQYHPPRTDEELAKRFKEVQTVLVACFLPHSMDLTDFLFSLSCSAGLLWILST